MLPRTFQPLIAVLAVLARTGLCQDRITSIPSRRLVEYQLPPAAETHEFARVPGTNLVLLSQMSDSQLIRIELDPATEAPVAYQSFPMGGSRAAGLHGVWPSTAHPGKVWLTLQSENKLLLVDPGRPGAAPPSVARTVAIPAPGNGPHCVFEFGARVWAGLKVASAQTHEYYVFAADAADPARGQVLYRCLQSPVFISEDPATGLVYVTQDAASSIMRINVTSGETAQLPIPPAVGSIPVGMTTVPKGPLAGVWFSLAGNATTTGGGGAGSFGRVVAATGKLQFFRLRAPAAATSLLHIADASAQVGRPALWLLSTSLLSSASADALICVTFDEGVTQVAGEEHVAMLAQNAMTHRVVPLGATVLVSQLHTFTLAQLTYNNTMAGHWLPSQATSNNTVAYAEAG